MTESPSGMRGRTPFESAEESVRTASLGDQPARLDHLGFKPYVEAVAEFLTNENTEPPLTLSVEGAWGSGKSSFLMQLRDKIEEKQRGALIVDFNAWRHDKEEALWAAFALEFTRQLSHSKPLYWWRRWWAPIWLIFRRFNWREGWVDGLRAFGIALVFIAAAVACLLLLLTKGFAWTEAFVADVTTDKFWRHIIQAVIASGGIAGYAVIVVSVWRRLTDLVGNPLAIDLRRYAKSPDYEGRVAFIEQFHEDFEHIVKAYAGRAKKVYVFIDDLDRCAVPKSAELMQALNLMLSQSPQLIYILGMDREKVAAAYAAKDADLLPFLAPSSTLPETLLKENGYGRDVGLDRVVGLEYGYAFVEKFVQIPFQVPRPTEADVRNLLDSLETARTSAVGPPTEEQKIVRKRINLKRDVTQDSETIRDIVLMVSPALDNNPRRILQFINLFRLRTFIACDTALFDEIENDEIGQNAENNTLTLQQLGKFVAISLRWPLFLADLEWYPKLLADLERYASESSKPLLENFVEDWPPETQERGKRTLRHWAGQQDLLRLLRVGIFLDDKSRIYSLADINVEKLLEVSPQTRPQSPGLRGSVAPETPPEEPTEFETEQRREVE